MIQTLQKASTARLFCTPGHGSPSLAMVIGMEHPDLPTHPCVVVQDFQIQTYDKMDFGLTQIQKLACEGNKNR